MNDAAGSQGQSSPPKSFIATSVVYHNRCHPSRQTLSTTTNVTHCNRCHRPQPLLLPPAATMPLAMRNQCDFMILDGSFLGGKAHIYMEADFSNDSEVSALSTLSSLRLCGHAGLAGSAGFVGEPGVLSVPGFKVEAARVARCSCGCCCGCNWCAGCTRW